MSHPAGLEERRLITLRDPVHLHEEHTAGVEGEESRPDPEQFHRQISEAAWRHRTTTLTYPGQSDQEDAPPLDTRSDLHCGAPQV